LIKKSAFGQGYATEAIKSLKIWADTKLDYEYLRYLSCRPLKFYQQKDYRKTRRTNI
jgi:RimJ/RimL family protein N-acetyltransferase